MVVWRLENLLRAAATCSIIASVITGLPQRHVSEMERGKRPIGKESAKKLAKVLNTDYMEFLQLVD